MFTDYRFYFPDGKARFNAVAYEPPAEEPDADYPYWLTTGRDVAQYLSGNQTRRLGYLTDQTPAPWVEIHPHTAATLGIAAADPVSLTSRRGAIVLPAKVVATIRQDTVFVPYHWAAPAAANQLTIARFDPKSWIPAFKACAVRLERADEPAPSITPPPVLDADGRIATPTDHHVRASSPSGAAPSRKARTREHGTVHLRRPSRCIGCGACVAACRECDTHRGKSMMNLDFIDRASTVEALPTVCMHCSDPFAPCAQVCPVDAILSTDDGVVHSPDASRCIGCENCVHACPWGVPKFDPVEQLAYKCNLCYDRTSVGLGPMCATVCPSDALYDGTAAEVGAARPNRRVIDVFGFGEQELQTGNWMVVPDDFHLTTLPLVQ